MSVCMLLAMSASSLTFLEGVTKHSRKTTYICTGASHVNAHVNIPDNINI